MKLTEKNNLYSIKNFFSASIYCGFTKKSISGLKIKEDFKKIALNFKETLKLVYLAQIHSSRVKFIQKEGLYEGDGVFTNQKQIMLVIKTADCLPLFFYDQKKEIIGLIHLGWRPALAGILENIKIDLSNFKVLAGVGLRKCCFKVGEEFLKYKELSPFIKWQKNVLFFDPLAFARGELIKQGLPPDNFKDLSICSFCQDKFYSYRREKTKKRTLSFIVKSR